ncbi:MAG: hypothetical protein JWL77_530 [Chthonomonadaceae bacterium]|nr:hypothetical protein [Chthonomonadaceae bacterium]
MTEQNDWQQDDEFDGGSEIGKLLDEAYDLLDGFVVWLEGEAGLDTRTAQQDCFNAESLLDYLANHYQKSIRDMNEFELRWFVFSHYIRQAIADTETEERLPDSLRRLALYLRAEQEIDLPEWVQSVLDDGILYRKRREQYKSLNPDDEAEWQQGYRLWCEELQDELDVRCLWLPRELGDGMFWGDAMGWREATLYQEANELWQKERATLLSEGLDYETVRSQLLDTYLFWIENEQERLEGRNPRAVILEERSERPDEEDTEDE